LYLQQGPGPRDEAAGSRHRRGRPANSHITAQSVSHESDETVLSGVSDQHVGKLTQLRRLALRGTAHGNEQTRGVPSPDRTKPLPQLPVGLGRHGACVDDKGVCFVSRPDHVEASRHERERHVFGFSLIQLASKGVERDAAAVTLLHGERL